MFISQRYKHASSHVLGRQDPSCRLKHLQGLNHLLLFCLRSPVCHFNLPATRRKAGKEAKSHEGHSHERSLHAWQGLQSY